MRALILSGGSNKGALQVGALRALVEKGIHFDMVIGVSIGSLNGAYFSYKPNLEGISELEQLWTRVRRKDIFPEGRLKALWRFIRNSESLFTNKALYRFLQQVLPARTFAELQLDFYVPAFDIDRYEVFVFGENKSDPLLDALMASSALPPYFPPWTYKGRRLIDGGFVSNLPYRIAIEKGAKEIYALHIVGRRHIDEKVTGLFEIIYRTMDYLIRLKIKEHEWEIEKHRDVKLHYIKLEPETPLSIFDFSRARKLIEQGYRITKAYLESRQVEKTGLMERLRNLIPFLSRR